MMWPGLTNVDDGVAVSCLIAHGTVGTFPTQQMAAAHGVPDRLL
jgi:hypothetical protein